MKSFALAVVLVFPLFGMTKCEAQSLDEAHMEAQKATELSVRKQFCEMAKAAGVPIRIDPKLRSSIEAKGVSPDEVNMLLLPAARVNNAWGCFCTIGDERKEYVCK